jgi:hypothetical protein
MKTKVELLTFHHRYGVSKLIQLMDTRSLAEAAPVSDASPVIITNVTPGFCKSDVFRDEGFGHKVMKFMQNLIGRKTEVGSRTLVDAISPVHGREIHGAFLWDCKPVKYGTSYIVPFTC